MFVYIRIQFSSRNIDLAAVMTIVRKLCEFTVRNRILAITEITFSVFQINIVKSNFVHPPIIIFNNNSDHISDNLITIISNN